MKGATKMNPIVIPKMKKYTILILFGGALYCICELSWRGWTHPSMALCGGLCFLMIYMVNDKLRGSSLIKQGLISCAVITTTELLFGFVLNILLGLNVWNYSNIGFDLLGQICIPFCGVWFIMSYPCIFISRVLKKCLG